MKQNNFEHFQFSQKIILYRPEDKKYLLMKEADDQSEYYKKYGPWELPGGRVEAGEDIEEAFSREIKEELGDEIKFEVRGVVAGCHMKLDSDPEDPYRVKFGYLTIFEGGEIHMSGEHSEYKWETAEEIEANDEYKLWLKNFIRNAQIHINQDEHLVDLKRAQADFENYKKRQAESQKGLKGLLIEKLVLDIVPVLDNFRSATQHVPSEQAESPWVKGIQYIEKQLEAVLVENGIQTIDAKEGDVFDPTIHEAVGQTAHTEHHAAKQESREVAVEKEEMMNIVSKVVQKGYKFGERVIRPARVIVN